MEKGKRKEEIYERKKKEGVKEGKRKEGGESTEKKTREGEGRQWWGGVRVGWGVGGTLCPSPKGLLASRMYLAASPHISRADDPG